MKANDMTMTAELNDQLLANACVIMTTKLNRHHMRHVERIDVELNEQTAYVDIYHINVVLKPSLTAYDIAEIAHRLDDFCVCDDASFTIDDQKFVVGDGDDGGAVTFSNGAFHIWLRRFAEE